MPKGVICKTSINKEIFMLIVKECKSSIIKLGECENIECTERTIRRALNDGKITPRFLDQIAKHLDVDSRLLSGELHNRAESYSDNFFKNMYLNQLKVENYPYYRKRKEDLNKQPIEELIEHILAIFEISFTQFDDLDFESQYCVQHDLFEALIPVIRKYFKVDAYGRKDLPDLERVIFNLDNYRENHYLHLYAEEVLRKKFLEKPPFGKTKSEIRNMDAEALIDLDYDRQKFYEKN